MHITIHDVDHGMCAVLTAPNGKRLMIDCGRSLSRPWSPSNAYLGSTIDTLIIQNLDEDHVEDLHNVWRGCRIGAIVSNPTVTAAALARMKATGGMGRGVGQAFDILAAHGSGFVGNWQDDLGGVQWHTFWNVFGQDFIDTNNLSLATFVTFGGFTILFGGDMECAGWRALLRLPMFRARLAEVNVFVASHHGRENGCSEELFAWMQPELVVMSDSEIKYGTQEESSSWYGARTIGIPDWTRPRGLLGWETRKVMTTRRDGTINFEVNADGRYLVTLEPRRTTASLPASSWVDALAQEAWR